MNLRIKSPIPGVFDACRRFAKWCIDAGHAPNSLLQELASFLAVLCRARVESVSRQTSAFMRAQRSGGALEHDRGDEAHLRCLVRRFESLSLIHISEPTRLRRISYAVFCL